MMVVPRIARREVQDLAPGTGEVLAAPLARGLDRRCCPCGRFEHAVDCLGQRIAGETPRSEDQLAVGVEINEAADASGLGSEFGGEAVEGLVLGRVAGGYSAVGLPAGVGGRAA